MLLSRHRVTEWVYQDSRLTPTIVLENTLDHKLGSVKVKDGVKNI